MRRTFSRVALLGAALLCLPSLAAADVSVVGPSWVVEPCTANLMGVRFHVVQNQTLSSGGISVLYGVNTTYEVSVYEAPTADGPFDRVFQDTVVGDWSGPSVDFSDLLLLEGNTYLLTVYLDPSELPNVYCYPSTEPLDLQQHLGWAQVDQGLSGTTAPPATGWQPAFEDRVWLSTVSHEPWIPAPVLSFDGPFVVPEGTTEQLIDASGTTDEDSTDLEYWFECEDSLGPASGWIDDDSFLCTGLYPDDYVHTVNVRVRDGDNPSVQGTTTITLFNVDPTAIPGCDGPCEVGEGQDIDLICDSTDPGAADVMTRLWDFGDGLEPAGFLGQDTVSFEQDGVASVLCRIEDDDGGSDEATLDVTVLNLPPTVAVTEAPTTAVEGSDVSWAVDVVDPGVLDVVEVAWSWGDGDPDGSGAAATHAWADEGTYTVEVTADDGEGGEDSAVAGSIVVENADPFLDIPGCFPTATEGDVIAAILDATDPGPTDVLTTTLTTNSSATVTGAPAVSPAPVALDWVIGFEETLLGSVDFTFDVVDEDGGAFAFSCSIELVWLDVDVDGMPDTWELEQGLDPTLDDSGLDPDGDGWTHLDEFLNGGVALQSDGPGAPVLVSPVGGAEIATAQPDLTWTEAEDPNPQTLSYDVEVYADASMVGLVAATSGVLGDGSIAIWSPQGALAEDASSWWRVRAFDGLVHGPWTPLETFAVNAVQESPGVPLPIEPLAGAVVATLSPTLSWSASVDPEGDDVTYEVEVAADAVFGMPLDSAAGLVGTAHTTGPLLEDSVGFWRVRALDEHGNPSAWSSAQGFAVDTVDNPPTEPEFVSPLDGDEVVLAAPVFEVEAGADPEGGDVDVEIEVDLDATFPAAWTSGLLVVTPPASVVWPGALEGVDVPAGDEAWARARTVDAGGLSSDWVVVGFLRPQGADDDDSATDDDDSAPNDDDAVDDDDSTVDDDDSTANDDDSAVDDDDTVDDDDASPDDDDASPDDDDSTQDDDDASPDDDDSTQDDDDASPDDDDSTPDDDDTADDDDAADDDDSAAEPTDCDCSSSMAGGAAGPWLLLLGLVRRFRR